MKISLRNKKSAEVRLLKQSDREALYNYLQLLSAESKSRFGPHPFDRATIDSIIDQTDDSVQRYVAIDEPAGEIVAYMLIKEGMIEADQERYGNREQFYDPATTVTFAPSVADAWQSTGLGSAMALIIEEYLISNNVKTIVLWGGVQATNTKAVNFYNKLGYRFIDSFWFDEKDNHDMVKKI